MTRASPFPLAAFGLAICIAAATAGTAAADVVAVVAATNPVATLTKAQVTDIFLGKANRFPNGAPARPIDQPDGSQARDEFYTNFAGKSPAQLKSLWAKIIFTGRGQPPASVVDGSAVKQWIAANPEAIGYLERSDVDRRFKIVAP